MADRPIDIILITGFLGAGKTTLLNGLLRLDIVASRPAALLINEFGAIGVDGRLVQAGGRPVLELNSGSLFCSCLKADLLTALADVAQNVRPELLLVEATGLAHSADLEAALDEPPLSGRFRVRANLCVVDATNFFGLAAFAPGAAAQVRAADALLVAKSDLVEPAEISRLREVLAAMNPRASVNIVLHGQAPPTLLEGLHHVRLPAAMASQPPRDIVSVSIRLGQPMDAAKFAAAIEELGQRLLRLKGTVLFSDGPRWCDLSAGRLSQRPAEPGSRTEFTAIAFGAEKLELMLRFQSCVASAQ